MPEQTEEQWKIEREQTITYLRAACKEFGDNDWSDNLHLVDIIENHLVKHLEIIND